MLKPLIIGSRGSALALAQAETVAAHMRAVHHDLSIELKIITTLGDRILDKALSAVGDKGLFVKELEIALLHGEIDIAVHSGKDLPTYIPAGLTLAAFPQRADPRDALVLSRPMQSTDPIVPICNPLAELASGATVGTSSLRRACQARALRPDLTILNIRGNVDTRLRKLAEGQYDALLLAASGLTRLGFTGKPPAHAANNGGSAPITILPAPVELMLPAVAQGALAIEARADDIITLERLNALNDPATNIAIHAERAFLRRLEGGCQIPIAAYADFITPGATLCLRGLVGSLDGAVIVRGEQSGAANAPEALGIALAEELLQRGAADILASIRATSQQS